MLKKSNRIALKFGVSLKLTHSTIPTHLKRGSGNLSIANWEFLEG